MSFEAVQKGIINKFDFNLRSIDLFIEQKF
jgi:hypothetical protein